MKISKVQLSAIKLASKDQTRPALNALHVVPKENAVVVTDGHKLVEIVNKDSSWQDEDSQAFQDVEPFSIEADSIKTIDKMVKKDSSILLDIVNANGKVNATGLNQSDSFTIPLTIEQGRFPSYKQIIPDNKGQKFGFDARYMRDICDLLIKASDQGQLRCVPATMQLHDIDKDCSDPASYAYTITNETDSHSINIVLMPARI